VVVATGPATWSPLARAIHRAAGVDFRFSFIGSAPLIAAETVDTSRASWEPRYPGAEPALYLPITTEELEAFSNRLTETDVSAPPGFDAESVLAEESSTVERVVADPESDLRRLLGGPRGQNVAVEPPALCLAPDDADGTAYHVEGLFTSMKLEDQRDALRAIEALGEVEILRPGRVQRTPWLPGADTTLASLQLGRTPRTLLTGTLTGVYGYAEAMALGAVAGIGATRIARGSEPLPPPRECLTGALCWALASHQPHEDGRMLQANYGMLPAHRNDQGLDKSERRDRQVERALAAIERYVGAD
jgi:tRNA:m(5)U-54 methyltransferase